MKCPGCRLISVCKDTFTFGLEERARCPGKEHLILEPRVAFVEACLRGSYPEPLLLTLPDFLHQAVEKGVFSRAPTGELPGME